MAMTGASPGPRRPRAVVPGGAGFIGSHLCESLLAEGYKVVTRLTWRGTHDREPFMGMPPTGRKVDVTAIFIHRIAGGKVKEEWSASDTLERLR